MTDWLTPPNRILLQHAVGDRAASATVNINGKLVKLTLCHEGDVVKFKPSNPRESLPVGVWNRSRVLDPLWITTSQTT